MRGVRGGAFLVCAVLLAGLFVAVPPVAAAYVPHNPILIEGDAGFTPQNGVTGGSGTSADPYVIEGWEITGSVGIEIRNTTSYFVIRDTYVRDTSEAIHLQNLSHATIADNVLWNGGYGVIAFWVTDLTVSRNTIATDFPTVWGGGVHPFRSSDVRITENRITRAGEGVYIQDSTNVTVASNWIEGDDDRSEGVRLWVSTEVTIVCNDLVDHSIAVRVFTWNTGIVAHHNNVLSSAYAQAQDGEANAWDDGYPGGGNHWSDYQGEDRYSGPNQDQPGPDGMGDTPYVIDSDSADRYPLMDPVVCTAPTTPPITSLRLEGPQHAADVTYIAPVSLLTFDVVDGEGFGVRRTAYRVDGTSWVDYTGAFVIPMEGERLVEWFSVDNLGTAEAMRSRVLRVDGTPPTTSLEIGSPSAGGMTLTASALDAGVGVARTDVRLDEDDTANPYTGPILLSPGTHTIRYWSTDALGNEEAERTLTIEVPSRPSNAGAAAIPMYILALAVIPFLVLAAWLARRRSPHQAPARGGKP